MNDHSQKIVEALEVCAGMQSTASHENHHNNCPYWNNGCMEKLLADVLALIYSQQEYIEALEIDIPLFALKTQQENIERLQQLVVEQQRILTLREARIKELKTAQTARLLTLEEVKAIGEAQPNIWERDKTVIIWIQINATNPFHGNLYPSHITYSYHPEQEDTEYMDSIESAAFGSEVISRFPCCDYNRTWRCWTQRPTDEQQESVKWG